MNPFGLAYREQQQLFLFDRSYIAAAILKTGGLSTVMARFIVQFFWNPYLATALTASLLALSSYLLWVFLRNQRNDWHKIAISLVPACFIGASISDNCLHFDYLISIILIESGLVIYKKIRSRRTLIGILMTIISYFIAGPAALVFAVCAMISELQKDKKNAIRSVSYLAAAVSCAFISYMMADTPSLRHAFTPAFHYDTDTEMPIVHWLGWICIPLATGAGTIRSKKIVTGAGSVLLAASLISCTIINKRIEIDGNITKYEYEHYTVNGQWEKLITSCKKHVWSPGTANYINMAYAYSGVLTDNLFKNDNRGVSSLLMMPESKSTDVRVAHIMFAMGNMAAAQNVAFNAICGTQGYSPAMVRMNAQIELMRGSYGVAEKYLSLLEKTVHYRSWARNQRKFLWNDSEVERDGIIGNGRKNMNVPDGFTMLGNPIDELMDIVEANPSDARAADYALSFLLLSKDIAKLTEFVDRYWGTPSLKTLPTPAQEALIFYSEYSRHFDGMEPVELDWCLSHGVSQSTVKHFEDFQEASLRSNGAAPSGYKGTYWNYLLYTQL